MARPAARAGSLYFDAPKYPYRRPSARHERHAVVVVGGGPVGLTAALELARHGVPALVLEAKGTVGDGSRAICIARHSLESLQQLGVSARFVAKALAWTAGTSYYRKQPVFRLEMPHSADERFHPMYNLQQQYIELFLAEAAMGDARVDLRWRHRVCGLANLPQGVEIEIDTPDGAYTVLADYVLAADGARSAVRQALDLKLAGEAYEGRYVIVDIQQRSSYPTERRAFFDSIANPGATILVHRQPDDIWRIDYQLGPEEDEQTALAEAVIRERIGAIVDMLGERAPWELEWWSLYKAYTLCLDDYRHGRVLFLGDAAHLVPIFGVRGLNSGFADAMNAAWKLAYVVRGFAPARLLDSYTPERRGATLEIFAQAGKSTRFMTPPTRGFRRVRDAVLALADRHDFARKLLDPRQVQPYTYADSALTTASADEASFIAGPIAGAPLRNRRLTDGSFLLDVLGRGFTLLYFAAEGGLPVDLAACHGRLAARGEPPQCLVVAPTRPGAAASWVHYISDPDGVIAVAHGAVDGTLYLVRPDRHVCARWLHYDVSGLECAFARALGEAV